MAQRSLNRDATYPIQRGPDGKRLCRWDQKPVASGRRSYCSEQCRIEVSIRTSASSLRFHVKQRDMGVCADCGCDTQKIQRVIEYAGHSFYNTENYGRTAYGRIEGYTWFVRAIWPLFEAMGFNRSTSFWEADHIKELSNGGDGGLDNIQTLCVPCHKVKTRRMHATRAQQRRDVKRGLLEVVN